MTQMRFVGMEVGPGRSDPLVRIVYVDSAGRKRFGLWQHLKTEEGQLREVNQLMAADAERIGITVAGQAVLSEYSQKGE